MRKAFAILFVIGVLTGCTARQSPSTSLPAEVSAQPDSPIPTPLNPVASSGTSALGDDFFAQMGITLPAPACNGLTQSQMEGPYYKPDTPERNSLLDDGMPGTRLILVGYVLDPNCEPLPDAWLDFWQADTGGEYDNAGYRLRGHQFTDAQGRYHLETILPGLYASRPIEHIHVKVRPEGGGELTSQLYFPQQPIEGLTVTIEDRGDHLLGYFNFVVQR